MKQNDIKRLEKYTKMYHETFEWGCNDKASYLYAHAVYSVVSGNEIYRECEDEFLEYMYENGIH